MFLQEYNHSRQKPFKVPEGYFENFEDRIMKQIDASEKAVGKRTKTSVKPLWRVWPFAGVAAAIALALVIAGLTPESLPSVSENTATEVMITQDLSDKNIESVYDYLVLDNETIYDYATE